MSSIKEYMFGLREDDMYQWIREHLDDEEADEETPGWDALAEEWHYLQEFRDESDAMNNWIRQHSYSEIHSNFLYKISNLRDLVEMQVATDHEETYYKMSFAHAVTLMESFLSDTVRSLVLSNNTYLVNAITKIDELKNLRFSLAEIIKFTDGIASIVTSELGQLMYHNIPKIRQVLVAILGNKLSIDISKICEITSSRHDIVHRDGKTLDGKFVEIDKQFALDTIMHIEIFVQQVASEISAITTPKNA